MKYLGLWKNENPSLFIIFGVPLNIISFAMMSQLAAVAALCVQYEADFRPNMTIVVKALQPLLNAKQPGTDSSA